MGVAEKRALLVHGWNDDPGQGWLHWLAGELTRAGYVVEAPHLVLREGGNLATWREALGDRARRLDEDSIIVAHSLGVWLTLGMVADLQHAIAAAYLVAGFYDAPEPGAKHYFEPEPDWRGVKEKLKRRVCIYGDDDLIVTPDRTRRLAHRLEADLICAPGHGHFLGSRGMTTFPELLELILNPAAS